MIRKSFFAVLSFILLFSVVVMQVQAEQLEPKEVKSPAGQKLSGIVSISANSFRANDVSSNDYNLFAWIKGNKFGGGVNITTNPESNYLDAKIFGSYLVKEIQNGSIIGIAGISSDSNGEDYIQTGAWTVKSFMDEKLNLFVDTSVYWSISGSAESYLDAFGELTYSFTPKISAGPVVTYDWWWKNNHHNLSAGLIGYYAISEKVSIFGRYMPEVDMEGRHRDVGHRLKGGIQIIL